MSNELTITSLTPHSEIIGWIKPKCVPSQKYVLKLVKSYKHRSLDQNGQSHVWYSQLAKELPEDNELGWKRYCKLTLGVPLLRAQDSQFRELYDKCIRKTLTYEQKLEAMDILPVTSRMDTEQFNYYLEAMQNHFSKRGVILEFLR